MGQIKDKNLYPQDSNIVAGDYLIGSDAVTGETKTYTLGSMTSVAIVYVDTYADMLAAIAAEPTVKRKFIIANDEDKGLEYTEYTYISPTVRMWIAATLDPSL